MTTIGKTKTNNSKETSGLKYLLMGLLAFLGLGYDAGQHALDQVIYGDQVAGSFFQWPWYAIITHWLVVIVVWALTCVIMYRWISKQNNASKIVLKWQNSLKYLLPIAIITSLALTLFEQVFDPNTLPQIYREYKSFTAAHGGYGILVSMVQNMYYFAESAMIMVMLILLQQAGQVWFKAKKFPWGGLGLAITWGVIHIGHGGFVMVWSCLFAMLAGLFYVYSGKNVWASYLFVLLLFII